MFHDLLNALENTLFMVFISSILTLLLAFPLSLLQVFPKRKNLSSTFFYSALNTIIRLVCAIPYLVIVITLIPVTHWLMGSGTNNFIAIIPLTLVAVPLFTKTCTDALQTVPKGLVDAAISLGATPRHLVQKVLLPEALPDIIYGFSQLLIHLLGFTVMLGVLGTGGIGKLLVERGYQDYHFQYVLFIVLALISVVILIQTLGRFLAYGSFKRLNNPQGS